ncbi:MAG TPA: aminotransferase class V-fold PLP-dependent enzyme [Cyclobacteriaceae bacterium]|nr:aminotransferase class V-fold PLP-dependent enzyme [Cyclobacteriaceae bacterium]
MTAGSLEDYFEPFRENTVGRGKKFCFPSGEKEIIYADWTASARGYRPIENCLLNEVTPFFANTHTQTTTTGTLMTMAYEEAKVVVKEHVHATEDDVLIFCGSGMTSAVNKLQRLLGLRIAERSVGYMLDGKSPEIDEALRPVVFVTSMEHHSNHVSWLETIADVEIIAQTESGNVDLEHFKTLLSEYKSKKNKIAAVTACSNVTGIQTPYHEIAKLIHAHDGLCFVDFASSAPYVRIDMHPEDPDARLDGIYFSMHKFLGGPGTPGVLIFNRRIYDNAVPDHPGGGTILYSNPWKARKYVTDVESREDGGTPPVLQGIKAAMCIRLKEEMGITNIFQREEELLEIAFTRLSEMTNVTILQGDARKRLGIISFIVKGAHYNLIVRLLNDKFGIQTRGGCSCAGTYGHRLLNVDRERSHEIWRAIRSGDQSSKPGWIRISIHPTMTDQEIEYIMDAIESTAARFREWMDDYYYDSSSNEYAIREGTTKEKHRVDGWLKFGREQGEFNPLAATSH